MPPKGPRNGDGIVPGVTGVDPVSFYRKVAHSRGAADAGAQRLTGSQPGDQPGDVPAGDQGIGQPTGDGVRASDREPGHGQVRPELARRAGQQAKRTDDGEAADSGIG